MTNNEGIFNHDAYGPNDEAAYWRDWYAAKEAARAEALRAGRIAEVRVTRRSRVGYGCTSAVEQTSCGLRVCAAQESYRGTPRALLRDRERLLRGVGVVGGGSCDYREALFVGGRRVVSADWRAALRALAEGERDEVVFDVEAA